MKKRALILIILVIFLITFITSQVLSKEVEIAAGEEGNDAGEGGETGSGSLSTSTVSDPSSSSSNEPDTCEDGTELQTCSIINNGAYGGRMVKIASEIFNIHEKYCKQHAIEHSPMETIMENTIWKKKPLI